MMKQLFFPIFASFLLFLSLSSAAQIPGMTSWQSDSLNETEVQFRMHDRSINNGYALYEVSFDMTAARCVLSSDVSIAIYENDGSGTYGTLRDSTTYDPGPGTLGFSTSKMTRIQIVSTETTEPLYARVEIAGVDPADDFELITPDCITNIDTSDLYDPNDYSVIAASLAGGTTHQGLLVNNHLDYYQITITPSNRQLVVSMSYFDDYESSTANLDLDLYLLGEDLVTLSSSQSDATSTTSPITETINEILDPGLYYIVVRPTPTEPSRNYYEFRWDASATPTYTISGTVQTTGGSALSGVSMIGLPGDPLCDASGNYAASVDHGWSGTVTPTLAGYTFDPLTATYSNVDSAQVQDYTATLNTYTISGTVQTTGGSALSGVSMIGLPGDPLSDTSGNYAANVDHGSSDTFVPLLEGYTFDPVSASYTDITSSQIQNFTAIPNIYVIDGHVLDTAGVALNGVIMSGLPGDPLTDVNGYYQEGVEYGTSITVTPTLDGYTFAPSSTDYNPVVDDDTTDYTGTPDPYLSVSPEALFLGQEAGANDVIDILSNVDWTVSCPATWISLSPETGSGDGPITITANTENKSTESRSATLTVTDGSLIVSIDVTQFASGPFLETTMSLLTLASTAGASGSVGLVSNIAWSVSEAVDWLSVDPMSGSNDGSITITTDLANGSFDSRTATVTITGDTITRNIEVTQSGLTPILEVSTTQVILSSELGAGQTVAITSNLNWSVNKVADWLDVTPASGFNDGIITVTALTQNEMVESRLAMLTVTGGGITRAIEVTQSGSESRLEVSVLTAAINSESGSYINVNITSNIDWNVSKDMWWLLVSPSFGSGDGVITLLADQANPDTTERIATVTIEGDTMVRQIVLTQAGAVPEPTGISDLPEELNNPFEKICLNVYPNPTSDRIFVESNIKLDGEVLLKLIDITGTVLYEAQLPYLLPGVPVEMDLSGYARGQYLMLIRNNRVQQVIKVMKHK